MLKQEILDRLRRDVFIRNELRYGMRVSGQTVKNWIAYKSPMLTTVKALDIISRNLNMSVSEILDEKVMA